MNSKKLIVVFGPTAIGKTSLAIELAKHYNTEIVSADSRQFYKEMSIGTAKPTKTELAAAKHHFVDNLSILDEYSAGDYERDVLAFLDDFYKSHDIAILCGGSYLFIHAVLEGFDEFPEVPTEVREEIKLKYQEQGIDYLRKELQERDPLQFEKIDQGNPQRMMRYLEVCIASNQAYSSFAGKKKATRSFETIKIGLELNREEIYNRINHRVDVMMENGLLEEVKSLQKHEKLNALQTVGYHEFWPFLKNEYNLERAVELLKRNSRRYAKRQLTWMKKDTEMNVFSPLCLKEIFSFIESKLR